MNTIPNIITNRDMMYLEELFYRNYYLFKELENKEEKDKEIIDILNRIRNMHEDHMYFIISSLKKENYFEDDNDE